MKGETFKKNFSKFVQENELNATHFSEVEKLLQDLVNESHFVVSNSLPTTDSHFKLDHLPSIDEMIAEVKKHEVPSWDDLGLEEDSDSDFENYLLKMLKELIDESDEQNNEAQMILESMATRAIIVKTIANALQFSMTMVGVTLPCKFLETEANRVLVIGFSTLYLFSVVEPFKTPEAVMLYTWIATHLLERFRKEMCAP